MPEPGDSPEYRAKKAIFDKVLTIYGRKPIHEALQDYSLNFLRLHLADSNKHSGVIAEIVALAEQRQIEIRYHSRKALSRISKNGKQDQGIAADILCPLFQNADHYLRNPNWHAATRLLALDGVSNPQNLGMIIRSACAGRIDGLLLAEKGNADLGPLAIKASSGTIFKSEILRCRSLAETLPEFRSAGFEICILDSTAEQCLFDYQSKQPCIFVLGNESEGVSDHTRSVSQRSLSIPMNNGVESLNVAITAALIAYSDKIG